MRTRKFVQVTPKRQPRYNYIAKMLGKNKLALVLQS